MRRLRIASVVVALVALLWTVPVAAQGNGSPPTSWGAFTGALFDWAEDLWRIVAGSETEPPPAEPTESDSPDSMALDGAGETSFESDPPQGEIPPGIDPDG